METRPGLQTTEFWAMVVTIVLPWLATIADNANVISFTPEKYRWVLPVVASAATAISAGLYAIGRGQAKQGIPYSAPPTQE